MTNYLTKTIRPLLFTMLGALLVTLTFLPATAQTSNPEAVVTDFLNVYNFTTDKAAQLANEFPLETYDWRPDEGIRSVREAILHIASANYFFCSMLGAETPEGVDPQSLEKMDMNKEEAVAALKESVEYTQNFLNGMSLEQLEGKIEFFGNEITRRQAMIILGDHASEHLGQLIAYARMNSVVPPWSQQ